MDLINARKTERVKNILCSLVVLYRRQYNRATCRELLTLNCNIHFFCGEYGSVRRHNVPQHLSSLPYLVISI